MFQNNSWKICEEIVGEIPKGVFKRLNLRIEKISERSFSEITNKLKEISESIIGEISVKILGRTCYMNL